MEPSGKIMLISPDQIQNFIIQEVATIKGTQQFVINPEEVFILNKATRVGSISTANQILSDGSLYFLHPYDPVFLLIPTLRKQGGRARPVSDLLIESNCTALESYLKLEEKLSDICSVVTHSQTMYFKLDDGKLAAWIEKKVRFI
jgi:hypothetical protein